MLLVAIHATVDIHNKVVTMRTAVNEFMSIYQDVIGFRYDHRHEIEHLAMKLEYMKLIRINYRNSARRKGDRKRIILAVPMNTVHKALEDHP